MLCIVVCMHQADVSRLPPSAPLNSSGSVAGVAWPVLKVQPKHIRFRMLNGAVSRALGINFEDANGKKYNDRCRIVGADGGVIGKDRTGNLGGRAFPTNRPLFTSNAYRWDVVCDFTGLDGSLYMTNEPYGELMKPIPAMFCNSHLLMRIDISASEPPSKPLFPVSGDAVPDYTKLPSRPTVVDQEIGAEALAQATRKALGGDYDRQLKFGKQVGSPQMASHCVCLDFVCRSACMRVLYLCTASCIQAIAPVDTAC